MAAMTLAERYLGRITDQLFIESVRDSLRECGYATVNLSTVIDWPSVSTSGPPAGPAARLALTFPSDDERDRFIGLENLERVAYVLVDRGVEVWSQNAERLLKQLRDRHLRVLLHREGTLRN